MGFLQDCYHSNMEVLYFNFSVTRDHPEETMHTTVPLGESASQYYSY
jgi:hypothetical protein